MDAQDAAGATCAERVRRSARRRCWPRVGRSCRCPGRPGRHREAAGLCRALRTDARSAGLLDQRHDHAARAPARVRRAVFTEAAGAAAREGPRRTTSSGWRSRATRIAPAPPLGGDGSTGAAGNVGGYNNFWIDAGDRIAVVNGESRSSLIVDPPNGRVPPVHPRPARARVPRRADGGQHGRRRVRQPGESARSAERCLMSFGSERRAADAAELLLQQQLPDRADDGSRHDPDGDGPRRAHDPHERQAPAAAAPAVDGRLDRALGRRYAGGRDDQLPPLQTPSAARRRTSRSSSASRAWTRDDPLPVHRRRSDDLPRPWSGEVPFRARTSRSTSTRVTRATTPSRTSSAGRGRAGARGAHEEAAEAGTGK